MTKQNVCKYFSGQNRRMLIFVSYKNLTVALKLNNFGRESGEALLSLITVIPTQEESPYYLDQV